MLRKAVVAALQGGGAGSWKPFRVCRKEPEVSRLSFADDMLLFADARETRSRKVLRIKLSLGYLTCRDVKKTGEK